MSTNFSGNSSIWGNLLSVFNIIFDFGFIFFPTIGYIHQYWKIHKSQNSFGFSKFISLVLFIAFIFRIYFWIGKNFDIVILFQSIVGILMQLILIKKCVELTPEYKSKTNSDYFDPKEFWNWPYFYDYFIFIILLFIIISLLSNILGYDNIVYIDILGIISAFSEALTVTPQIIENFKSKNVSNLSFLLIFCWCSGDALKIFFYVKSNSPVQLLLCGFAQFFSDLVVIGQIFYYSKIHIKNKQIPEIEEIKNVEIKERR